MITYTRKLYDNHITISICIRSRGKAFIEGNQGFRRKRRFGDLSNWAANGIGAGVFSDGKRRVSAVEMDMTT